MNKQQPDLLVKHPPGSIPLIGAASKVAFWLLGQTVASRVIQVLAKSFLRGLLSVMFRAPCGSRPPTRPGIREAGEAAPCVHPTGPKGRGWEHMLAARVSCRTDFLPDGLLAYASTIHPFEGRGIPPVTRRPARPTGGVAESSWFPPGRCWLASP